VTLLAWVFGALVDDSDELWYDDWLDGYQMGARHE